MDGQIDKASCSCFLQLKTNFALNLLKSVTEHKYYFVRKKIINNIYFLRGWEEKKLSVNHVRFRGQVGLSAGPNGTMSEIYT